MKDREFLEWIWWRLHRVHKEDENIDYMRKLWAIKEATPLLQETPNTGIYPWEKTS